jgi:hypothetical protein
MNVVQTLGKEKVAPIRGNTKGKFLVVNRCKNSTLLTNGLHGKGASGSG